MEFKTKEVGYNKALDVRASRIKYSDEELAHIHSLVALIDGYTTPTVVCDYIDKEVQATGPEVTGLKFRPVDPDNLTERFGTRSLDSAREWDCVVAYFNDACSSRIRG